MPHLKKTPSGHLRKNPATGHLVKGCAGCCVTPCPGCPDTTPATILVTITGWTACGCTADGAFGYSFEVTAGDLNGSACLRQTPGDACVYEATVPITVNYYTTSTACAGAPFASTTNCTLRITRVSGGWDFIAISRDLPFVDDGGGGRIDAIGFQGHADAADCSTPFSIDNIQACLFNYFAGEILFGTGGTAACTPDGC